MKPFNNLIIASHREEGANSFNFKEIIKMQSLVLLLLLGACMGSG